jgi:hypothetical protein
MAVKRPGSLKRSAFATTSCQVELLNSALPITSLLAKLAAPHSISICALARPPFAMMSAQRLPVSVASRLGSPARRCGNSPRYSLWSATTRKSSGRASRSAMPLCAVTVSPRAKR